MKNISLAIVLSSMFLLSCGGSGGSSGSGDNTGTQTSQEALIESLSYSSWEKACFPMYNSSTDELSISWYAKRRLRIDASLKATYITEFFRPLDTVCESMVFDTTDISRLEITNKVISEESIEAYGLNETFIFSSEGDELLSSYTLIYIDSEKLYFGQASGENLGETSGSRHSSISLDDYFSQIIN